MEATPKQFSPKKMITLKQLKDFCEKNNVRFEMHPQYSKPTDIMVYENGKYVWKEHRTLLGYEFGMNNIACRSGKSEWNWTWFETIGCYEEPKDDTVFYFRERYSQVNGKSYTGWRESMKAEDTIMRKSA